MPKSPPHSAAGVSLARPTSQLDERFVGNEGLGFQQNLKLLDPPLTTSKSRKNVGCRIEGVGFKVGGAGLRAAGVV